MALSCRRAPRYDGPDDGLATPGLVGGDAAVVNDERLAEECSEWIADQLMTEYGGFISPEFIDIVIEFEQAIRDESPGSPIDHIAMSARLVQRLIQEENAPTGWGGVNDRLIQEILYFEDDFWSMAGLPRGGRRGG